MGELSSAAGLGHEEITKAPPLYEQVYRTLHRALLQGHFEPGARLTETQLSRELGVSRTPIREALRQLQQDRLLTADEQGRVKVLAPDFEDIEYLYECRMVLEILAARRAAGRISDDELSAMEQSIKDAEQAMDAAEPLMVLESNTLFHDTLALAAGNPRLADLLGQVRAQIIYMRAMVIQAPAGVGEGVLREHRGILSALRERNSEKAAAALRNHLEADLERFRRQWAGPGKAAGADGKN